MRRRLIQFLLPAFVGLLVGWWLSYSQEPRSTLTIPRYRQRDFVSLEISPKGRFLLARNFVTFWSGETRPDEFLQCWDLDRGELRWLQTRNDEDLWNTGVFAPDDERIAVPTKQGTVRLWSLATGVIEAELPAKWLHPRASSLAFTKDATLVGLMPDGPEGEGGVIVYEVASGRELHRLPKGHVTSLGGDVLLHSFEGHLRPFHIEAGLDISKPYQQDPFCAVERNAKGDLVRSFSMGHEFEGCTHDQAVLFGTFRLGGMTSSTFFFYHDYETGSSDSIDAGWGTLDRTFLRPSWSRKYLLKTDSWLPRDWYPEGWGRSLALQDYHSKRSFFSIPGGETGAFSHDDRVLATYVGGGQIRIWDLPPRTPWLMVIGIAAGTFTLTFLILRWAIRRNVTVQAPGTRQQ